MKIPEGKEVAFDCETTGLSTWNGARPFYFSFCNEEGDVAKFRWKVDPMTRAPEIVKADYNQMQDFFEDDRRVKIAHNSKFDIRMMDEIGIKVKGRVEDTYFAAHTLKSNEFTFGLKPLCKKYLDFPDDDEKALRNEVVKLRRQAKKNGWNIAIKGRDGKDPWKADLWLAADKTLDPYGCGDAERAMLLWKVLREELSNDPVCKKFYDREIELQKVTYRMETRGVRVRPEIVDREIKVNKDAVENCIAKLRNEIGAEFNPNSSRQVADYVYGKLKNPVIFWTNTGQPAVHSEALQGIDHPVVRVLQKHNSHEKAITNFFQKYKDNSHPDELDQWILHPDFNQVGPITGRYSCRNPNLQNVANALTTRSEIPIQARTPFCPRVGYMWLSIDYSGQEVWIFADGSKEEQMLKALYDGRDLHAEVADFIWGAGTVAKEKLLGKKTSRAKAKMLFFGIIYGMGVPACAAFLKCSEDEARAVLKRYKDFFPRVDPFMKEIMAKVKEDGYIQTAWGRKIFVDHDYGYKATNYYVQGSGADMIKDSMIRLDKYLKWTGLDARIVMTIHDELIFEIRKADLSPKLVQGVIKIMEDHQGNLGIKKLPVELSRVTTSWNLKEEIKDANLLFRKAA